jgi:hypothetical protein
MAEYEVGTIPHYFRFSIDLQVSPEPEQGHDFSISIRQGGQVLFRRARTEALVHPTAAGTVLRWSFQLGEVVRIIPPLAEEQAYLSTRASGDRASQWTPSPPAPAPPASPQPSSQNAASADEQRVFISYAREDSAAADRLYAELDAHPSLRPWRDTAHLVAGDDWEHLIWKEVGACDYFVILWSEHAMQSEFVQRELQEALNRARHVPRGHRFVIPLQITECQPHEHLGQYQHVDLFRDWQAGLTQLYTALGIQRYTHWYVARPTSGSPVLVPIGVDIDALPEQKQAVNLATIPPLDPLRVPHAGLSRDGILKENFLKLWSNASAKWPAALYRKADWNALDQLLFSSARSAVANQELAETFTRLWALARELRPHYEEDWRGFYTLIQQRDWL